MKDSILFVLDHLHKCDDIGERVKILNFIIDNISDPNVFRQKILIYESDLRVCRRVARGKTNSTGYENKKINGEWVKVPFNFTEQEIKVMDFLENSEKIVDLSDYFSKNILAKNRDNVLNKILEDDSTQT